MSINRGMDKKMWYVYTMEYYSAIKKNEIMPFAATWMDLQIIILSEVSQSEKANYLTLHLKELQKEEQTKPKVSRRKEAIDRDFPGGTVVKNLPASAEDTGSSPGPGGSHMPWSN